MQTKSVYQILFAWMAVYGVYLWLMTTCPDCWIIPMVGMVALLLLIIDDFGKKECSCQ
jgi:hypothetical protein